MQNDILADGYDIAPTEEEMRAVIKTRFAPKNVIWRSLSFAYIHCVLAPLARLRVLVGMHHVVREHKKLRGYKRSGYFLYGKLPSARGERRIPLALCNPKHTYTVTPSRVKGGKTVISPWRLFCGDIPTPATPADTRAFLEAVEKRAVERGAVVVYPETLVGIDPALDAYSFPARFDEPAFCFTTVTEYTEGGKPYAVTYLDGPFYAKSGAPLEEQTEDMRARICDCMAARRRAAEKETPKA